MSMKAITDVNIAHAIWSLVSPRQRSTRRSTCAMPPARRAKMSIASQLGRSTIPLRSMLSHTMRQMTARCKDRGKRTLGHGYGDGTFVEGKPRAPRDAPGGGNWSLETHRQPECEPSIPLWSEAHAEPVARLRQAIQNLPDAGDK